MTKIKEELSTKRSLSEDWEIEFEIKSHDSEKAKELHQYINEKFYELSKELSKFDENEDRLKEK